MDLSKWGLAPHILTMIFEPLCRFAEALRGLLRHRSAQSFEAAWNDLAPGTMGWDALQIAWRRHSPGWEPALAEVDALLQLLLKHLAVVTADGGDGSGRVDVFIRAELERLQHATAAALVAHRFGTAGLQTVLEDRQAPQARRYFALLAAADRHPRNLWPLFRRHLEPGVHHAFQAAAVEAARFYPEHAPTRLLIALFESIRTDEYLRTFLSPRILESLFVLDDPRSLPLWRGLLVIGHTHADPEWCEVTRALVMIRRLTGQIESNVKFPDVGHPATDTALDDAEAVYRQTAPELHPVALI